MIGKNNPAINSSTPRTRYLVWRFARGYVSASIKTPETSPIQFGKATKYDEGACRVEANILHTIVLKIIRA
jgi:hypothetical protein